MEISFDVVKGVTFLKIKYTPEEYEMLSKKFSELGLEKSHTNLGLGNNLEFDYWRDVNRNLLTFIKHGVASQSNFSNLIDDINQPILYDDYDDIDSKFNICVFRIIPTNEEVMVPIDSYISINMAKNIMNTIVNVLSRVMSIVTKMNFSLKIEQKKLVVRESD